MSLFESERIGQSRFVRAGPELDRLVAEKVFGNAEVHPYSTDEDYTSLVCFHLGQMGYQLDFEITDIVTTWLVKDSKADFHAWGFTIEEAACRSALRVFGSIPG